MPTIEIAVKNKIARQTNDEVYVCGNSDFVIAFDFDTEWEAYAAKTARLKYNGQYQEVVFTGNECPVPVISNTNNIQIGVYAGDLHTTTAAVVMSRKSILCGDGVHEAPPEDVYNQLVDLINSNAVKGKDGSTSYLYAEIDENGHLLIHGGEDDDITFRINENGELEVVYE